jgi:hypothetical protein
LPEREREKKKIKRYMLLPLFFPSFGVEEEEEEEITDLYIRISYALQCFSNSLRPVQI